MTEGAGKDEFPACSRFRYRKGPGWLAMVPTMDMSAKQSTSTDAQHMQRARYFRTMALTASTADVAITLVRLAVHYERLARQQSPAIAVTGETDETQPDATRPRQRGATHILW
jgi:hypothetical protein